MNKRFSLISGIWFFSSSLFVSCSFAASDIDSSANTDIQAETRQQMHKISEEFGLPSFSLALSINNEMLFQEAVGFADIAAKTLASPDTQYSVGSVAKPMTGIALMRLVQDGKAQISENVAMDRYSNITLAQLASHTAGIKHDTPERDVLEFEQVKDRSNPREAFSAFEGHDLLFEPGTGFQYSSNGYILLSAVVAAIADRNFDAYLREQVFAPLNMTQTRFDNSVNSDSQEASYYRALSDNGEYLNATKKRDRSFLFGAGGYMSTPGDLVKMASALFNEEYLGSDYVQQMLTPIKLNSGEVNEEKYAIGWRVGSIALNEKETLLAAHHGGVTDKASTAYILVLPEKRAAIAFATNMVPPKFWRIRGKVARILVSWLNRELAE